MIIEAYSFAPQTASLILIDFSVNRIMIAWNGYCSS